MVLTAAQTTAFFESPDQMVIPHVIKVEIQLEGIQSIADLADFEKDSLQQLASKPSIQELAEPEDVYFLTPTIWNPHSDAYVINKE